MRKYRPVVNAYMRSLLMIILVGIILPFNLSFRTISFPLYARSANFSLTSDQNNLADLNACGNYSTSDPVTKTFKYVLNGNSGSIDLAMYPGLVNCLAGLHRDTSCPNCSESQQEDTDDKNMIDNIPQTQALSDLMNKIEQITPDKNDQARIATSLVQGFKYADTEKDDYKYPYKVAFDQAGICNETSKLLLNLYKQLGFGSAMFTFVKENHQAVGIKCDPSYSYKNTGYCFVETTSRAAISDPVGEQMMPRINVISDGLTFDASQDYKDAQKFDDIYNKKRLSSADSSELKNLAAKYGI